MPAFVTSELKSAFQIGFMIFIPFLVIDMVVSSILMSLGMMMLSPVLVALPFKLMLFVLADGWNLLIGSLGCEFCTLKELPMTSQMVLTIGRDALTLLLMISMPVLGVVMAVGLLVSIFQAVTQIHEANACVCSQADCCDGGFCHCRPLDAQHPGGLYPPDHRIDSFDDWLAR